MNPDVRRELLQQIAELWKLYPSMRYGQLLCFVATLGDDDPLALPQDRDDQRMIGAVRSHIQRRKTVSASTDGSRMETASSASREIFDGLSQLGCKFPQWSLGRLVFHLAALAHENIYDIENEKLLRAVSSTSPGLDWFEQYDKEMASKSIICERKDEPTYRCPCCRHRTLHDRGQFEICPVCYWEDDGQDDADADTVRGGPNGSLSLTRARENYLKFGSCGQQFSDHVRGRRQEEV